MKNLLINKYFIGAHLSIRGSFLNIFKEAEDLNISVIGCFTAPNLRYDSRVDIKDEVLNQFHHSLDRYQVFSHAGYLINIADKNKEKNYERSMEALEAEIMRSQKLHLKGIAFHPGSNRDEKEGLDTIISSMNSLEKVLIKGNTKLLIEPSAHQGSTLPWSIEQIAYIIDGLYDEVRKKAGIVVDTCHVFSSGYDISNKETVYNFLERFDKRVGISWIHLIHLNDSKFSCGSQKDRHQTIGKGKIGFEGLLPFITHPYLKNIPKILETPVNNYMEWKAELDEINKRLEF